MNFRSEDAMLGQDVDPEPGWSGLYDPWNGRRRPDTPFELFPQSELYYSTELSDDENDDSGSGQQEKARDGGDEHEDCSRSPSPPMRGLSPIWGSSPSRSPSPPRCQASLKRKATSRSTSPSMPPASRRRVRFDLNVVAFYFQPSIEDYQTIPVQFQGKSSRRDKKGYSAEAPF